MSLPSMNRDLHISIVPDREDSYNPRMEMPAAAWKEYPTGRNGAWMPTRLRKRPGDRLRMWTGPKSS